LIAVVFLLAGQGNLLAVSIAQGVLFVLATLEIYVLTILVLRRPWIALVVGLLVGTSTYLLGFVKPLLVEGLTLWLAVSLALVVVLFIQTMKPGYFWAAAGFTLALFMTRPEWVYLPVPLFLYLLMIARRRGNLRRMLPHSIAAVVLLYLLLGLFIYQNATQNGYAGITYIQNINLLGKVLQYHMQNEAPTQYAGVAQVANTFVQQGGWDPNQLVVLSPSLRAHHWSLAGSYASAVLLHHPVEFLIKTIPVLFTSSKGYSSASPIQVPGPFASPLLGLEAISGDVYRTYQLFPLLALLWAVLFFWRRTSRLRVVETMGAVVFLAVYELTVTSLGGYVQYWRLHIPFDPLLTLIIWGSALATIPFWKPALARLHLPWRLIWRGWIAAVIVGMVGGAAILLHTRGIKGTADLGIRLLLAHPLGVFLLLLLVAAFTLSVYRWQRVVATPGALAKGGFEQMRFVNRAGVRSSNGDEVSPASQDAVTPAEASTPDAGEDGHLHQIAPGGIFDA
jgi:hypothetical protein